MHGTQIMAHTRSFQILMLASHVTPQSLGGGGGYNIIMYTILYSDMSGQLKQSWYGMVILGDC